MKGCIPVEIPTKQYIKAYIIGQLGEKPKLERDHPIGKKLEDVLQHTLNERKKEFATQRYNAMLRIYIPRGLFRQRGANLNETNIKNFNLFVESYLKRRFFEMMDDFIEVLPSFEANLPEARRRLDISIEDWSDDSMKKNYYRYRKATGKPLLYNKIVTRTVPSVHICDFAF